MSSKFYYKERTSQETFWQIFGGIDKLKYTETSRWKSDCVKLLMNDEKEKRLDVAQTM